MKPSEEGSGPSAQLDLVFGEAGEVLVACALLDIICGPAVKSSLGGVGFSAGAELNAPSVSVPLRAGTQPRQSRCVSLSTRNRALALT